ncbi:MAG: DUF2953 domain-containing protein [Methanosarcinales archaeon]|jgi:hypothetical protein|nr:DUF2953 domain-containing protein [Methanosarcinales archaeon]
MIFQTDLMTAGSYLLFAVGLILLFIFLILAAAFFLTFFIRLFADISLKTKNGKTQKSICIRLKILFYEMILSDIDDFADDPKSDFVSETDAPEKTICHVTVTDEKITVSVTESKKGGSDYEVLVHADDSSIYNKNKITGADIEEEAVADETVPADDAFNEENEAVREDQNESDDEFDGESDSGSSDFSDEIKRYIDLSDPKQFVSDSISAAVGVSKAAARFFGDLLLRIKINNVSADVIYGLADPSNTALSFGAVHSFKASVYAYLADVENRARSSKRRKKAAEIGVALRDDIHVVPDLTGKTFEADADMSFSFSVPHFYIPALRFILNKNMRRFIRRYFYPYFIRHYIRTWKAERRQKKAEKKLR